MCTLIVLFLFLSLQFLNNITSQIFADKGQPLVGEADLEPSTIIALSALSDVSRQLGIENTSWSRYQTSLTSNLMEVMDLELQHQDLDELSWTIAKQKKSSEQELEGLKELLASLRRQRVETDEKQMETWKTQTAKLKQHIQQEPTKPNLDDVRVTYLRRLEQQTNDQEKQVDQIQNQLEQYYDLPCDIALASTRVQEKVDTMAVLEKERERLLAEIARSMY